MNLHNLDKRNTMRDAIAKYIKGDPLDDDEVAMGTEICDLGQFVIAIGGDRYKLVGADLVRIGCELDQAFRFRNNPR